MTQWNKAIMALVLALMTGIGIAAGDGIRDIVRSELSARREQAESARTEQRNAVPRLEGCSRP